MMQNLALWRADLFDYYPKVILGSIKVELQSVNKLIHLSYLF